MTVRKVFSDSDNNDGYRPESVCLQLYESGNPSCMQVQLSASNNVTNYTFTGVETGSYTVRETGVTCPQLSYHEIPAAYQQVEWIQSSGTQYINTGVLARASTGFEVDFITYNEVGGINFGAIIGSYGGVGTDFQLTTWSQSGSVLYSATYSAGLQTGIRQSASLINGVYTSPSGNIKSITNSSLSSLNSSVPIAVFTRNTANGPTESGSVRLFSLKMYDGVSPVRDFYPVYRKSDGVIGLYDTVNGVFYTNQGTGTFLKGSDVCGRLTSDFSSFLDEYQPVEYIKSTGTQCFDTGVEAGGNKSFDMKILFSNITTTFSELIGTYIESQYNGSGRYFFSARSNGFVVAHNNDTIVSSKLSETNTIYNISAYISEANQNLGMTVNGESVISSSFQGTYTNPGKTLYMLCRNDWTIPIRLAYFTSGNLYSAKLFSDNVLVRNFIPCYRKSDNEIGVFDTVNKNFYTNIGTGSFQKGPNL